MADAAAVAAGVEREFIIKAINPMLS